jgi:hypothetical protein
MARTYFDTWAHGCHAEAVDWYKDGLVYLNIKKYRRSTAVDRPDEEKGFLLKVDEPYRLRSYADSIANAFADMPGSFGKNGETTVYTVTLPPILPAIRF